MAKQITNSVNSGVQANVGMDFQIHCTIFLFLENFNSLYGQRYFITIEHLEDIVFGYLDSNEELTKVETYQAKKATSAWKISDLYEILQKITEASQSILDDSHPKSSGFFQENYFATNNTIDLTTKVKTKSYREIINEAKSNVHYPSLDQNIKTKIEQGNSTISFTSDNLKNLATLNFKYIDLSRTSKSQKEHLHGKFQTVFKDQITDHMAALDTFILCLDKLDSTFNQGNSADLSDLSKRVESHEIEKLLALLTTKKLAYDFWRDKSDELCKELKISLLDRSSFELHYQNSFDLFKDLNSREHQKVFNFLKSNISILGKHTTDIDCISDFIKEFNKVKSTTLSSTQLKATISAAYIEIKNTL
ncbi:dsDNA nuclease domain-containing protein [Marinigracilibium pacificum]|uniref:CD-NTase associated protein 4-like DNA endonuclease domain-containing protein n=1 Tax=Marinigracilibium pacificum TaxID=2729599 RepID=A0A848J619_9BACT|nr:dsDNA nuclease domain-containing protein [Marinigracilibium pacificum]NMM50905.1 hypothetical protein [Marinigracilibium pacificum]